MKGSVNQLEAAAILELVERKNTAHSIFRPQKHQEPIFEQPRPKYMLVGGGNRGGKTVSLTALTTAVAKDVDIIFSDGTRIPARMPWQKDKALLIWLVCIDQRHIGEVLYPAFFKAGMFKVAYDNSTKSLRSYDPEEDPKRGISPKLSPPFIQARYIESISWESKADNIFNRVTIKCPVTGKILANIHAFTSKSDPPQGRAVDFIMVDEQLARAGFIDELKARLVDTDGQLVWSSWNDEDSDDLASFTSMLDREIELESGVAKRVTLTMSGNKHLSRKSVQEFLAGCATEEERNQRDLGIAPSERLKMYPLFHKEIHTALIEGPDEDELSRVLRRTDGIPPDTWTKTLVLDPGTQNPAILLCAVPPPELGDYFVAYQEIYPGRADPIQLANIAKKEVTGQKFYRFIVDRRAGRQQTMGSAEGNRVVDSYSDAFSRAGLKCSTTGTSFIMGSDDVGGRQLLLQGWMHPGKSAYPQLRVVTHRCPQLCEQLRKIKKKVVQKEVQDERKVNGQPSDVVDCLEYFAASHPRYIMTRPTIEDGSPGYRWYMKKFGKNKNGGSIQIGTRY